MKFKNIYTVAAILGLFVLLQSRSGGPATQANLRVTGGPSEGTCANPTCHTAGSFEPTLTIELLEGTTPVLKYEPGKTYTLKITNTPGTGNPARYGFQALALNESNAQAGEWASVPAGMAVKTLSSKSYIEHSAPKATGEFEIPWVAPAAGTGDVTFYSAGAATNNNGQVSGDGMAQDSTIIVEKTTSSTFDPNDDIARMEVMPNPVADMLNLRINTRQGGAHKIRIFSADGTAVKTAAVTLQSGKNEEQVSVSDLAPGLYLVQLCGDGHMAAVQMLKK